MVELSVLGRILHLLPAVINKFICGIVPKHHSVILGDLHLITGVGLSFFEVLAISEYELGIILIAILRFLDYF